MSTVGGSSVRRLRKGAGRGALNFGAAAIAAAMAGAAVKRLQADLDVGGTDHLRMPMP
jgi:hypothetical protein